MINIIKSYYDIISHPQNKNNLLSASLRILWWKINQISFKLPAIIEIAPQRKCICYPDSSFGSLIVYTKRPEFLEMILTEQVLTKKSNFIDVGSGIGDFSLIASSKIKTGKILAIEPSQKPLNNLRENISLNNLEKMISITNEVASNKKGLIYFEEKSISEVSHITTDKSGIPKNTNTLDNIIRDNDLNIIDLIKIDVEGAENLVLSGLKKSFYSSKVKTLIIELNRNASLFNSSKRIILRELIKCNFVIYQIGNKKLKRFNKKIIKENKTINVLAVHKSFDKKSIINQFLS